MPVQWANSGIHERDANTERSQRTGGLAPEQGMTCDHCAGSVTAEVTQVPGVTDVSVDVASSRITVTTSEPVPASAIEEAVEEAGYTLVTA